MSQAINENLTAPKGVLDGGVSGDSQSSTFNSFQEEYLNSAMGGFLAGLDDAEAKLIGGDKSAFQISKADQSTTTSINETALMASNSKYFDIPNPATDIYNTTAAQKRFDQIFDPQKAAAVA